MSVPDTETLVEQSICGISWFHLACPPPCKLIFGVKCLVSVQGAGFRAPVVHVGMENSHRDQCKNPFTLEPAGLPKPGLYFIPY